MNTTALASFLACIALVAALSWYKTRRAKLVTSTDYFLGSRSFNFFLVAGGLFLTNISCNQFIGENESVYINNMSVMAWGLSSVFAMLVVSEFLIPVYLRIGAVTTPDFLEQRFDSGTKKIVSIIFLAGYLLNLIPAVLYGGAIAFNGIFHLSDKSAIGYEPTIISLVVVLGVVGCGYSVLGGLKAIAISDTILGFGLFLGGLILPYFAFKYLGEGDVMNGINTVLQSKTEHLNSIGDANDAVPFSTIFTGMLLMNLYYWGMEQFIVQQALAAKNLKESQKGIALASFFKLLSPILLNVPGLIAVHLYSDMKNTAEVFPRLVSDVLPPVGVGFIAAIIFGATLSTLTAGLNSSSTLLIMNLYKPYKAKRQAEVSEKHLVKVSGYFQVGIIVLAICVQPFIMFHKGGFYSYLQMVSGFFCVPIFSVLFIGFVTKRVPPVAAKVGMSFFVVSYVAAVSFYGEEMHYLHIMAVLFLLTVSLMLLIGKYYPMEVPFRLEPINVADQSRLTPWKHRHFYTMALLLLMALMFLVFSPLGLAK